MSVSRTPAILFTVSVLIAGIVAVPIGVHIDKLRGKLPSSCEVTWYRAKDHTVAANPRHQIPDGAYIKFTNYGTAPARIVIVRKRGHMKPGAKADFDLCPEAFEQLAPLSDGRLKQVEWQIVFP
jgi:hypothetical protein